VDDDDYVQALQAILTDPEPTGIDPGDPDGTADDGIDRFDGFGREVLVESLAVAGGDHGAELVVTFALTSPPETEGQRVPARGVVRLPLDREWRELSGYADPAAYAPEVANRVMRAAHEHVVRHHQGRDWLEARNRARGSLPSHDEQWRMLLDALSMVGRPVEVAPGRIELHLADGWSEDGNSVVTVLVTPEEWEEVLAFRAGDDHDLYVDELLASRDDDERFVVFHDGDLACSTREQLPPVRGRALARKLAALGATRPGAELGWYAHRITGPHLCDPSVMEEPMPRPEDQSADAQVPNRPDSVGAARAFLVRLLDGWGITEDVIDDASLLTSELIGNAVKHGSGVVQLRIELSDGTLRVGVHDDADELPQGGEASLDKTGGRGLWLVRCVAADWGSEPSRDDPGKTIWFELDTA
jgi:anti-sigma regulatory factor (Ser/Thr protein kinase)